VHELASFRIGDLPSDQLETIAEHLRGCQTCETNMNALAEPIDELVVSLRRLAGRGLDPEDLVPDAGEGAALQESFDPSCGGEPVEEPIEQVREYRILEKVGQGGMGTVFRAVHSRLGRTVAIKILRVQGCRSPDRVARFHREMKAVGTLDHPNIVRATDAGEWRGTEYLVMEFIDGMDVGTLLRRFGPLPVANAAEIVRQAALGLAHAHAHAMVHRDIKPSNLLLSTEGLVKLSDLGLVLGGTAEEAGPVTSSHYVLGSLEYMAPEQADDPHRADSRADLYALGCTLYELLAGRPPFGDPNHRTVLQKIKAHATAPIPPLNVRRADIPQGLGALVEKLLAKDPADRPGSAAQLAEQLAPFAAGSNLRSLLNQAEAASPRPAPAEDGPARAGMHSTPRRWFSRWVGFLLAAAIALVAAVVIYVQTDQGTLEIVASDDDIKVSVEKGGKVIEIVDLQKKKSYRLESGEYELKIVSGKQDFEIEPRKLTLRRGKTEIVRIRRLDNEPLVQGQWPPLDKAWAAKVGRMATRDKAAAIVQELVRRNPGFDGTSVQIRLKNDKLDLIVTRAAKLLDLTPIQAAAEIDSVAVLKGELADLSPLKGLPLKGLDLVETQVADLAPLRGMQLKYLNLNRSSRVKDLMPVVGESIGILDTGGTAVSDLTPLKLMPNLSVFSCAGSRVTDLKPLAGLAKLTVLNCRAVRISDLKPLEELEKLRHLEAADTAVEDLRPLAKLPLTYLDVRNTKVTDFTPLQKLPIEQLLCDFDAARDGAALRSLPKLKEINGKPRSEALP
jgi:serine/threonine protein kinase